MNDEQSGPELAGSPDLTGSADPGGALGGSDSPAGFGGAPAGESNGRASAAQPVFSDSPGGDFGGAAGGVPGGVTDGAAAGRAPGRRAGGAHRAPPAARRGGPTAAVPGAGVPGAGAPGAGMPGAGAPTGPGPADQADAAEVPPDEAAIKRKNRSAWRELPILIVVALAIALVIKTFVVQPFFIPSSSMEDTLMVGDKVLANKLVYHFRSIEPGDIVIFNGVGSWNPAPPPTKPASDPLVRAYDATLRPLFHSIAGLFGTPIGQTDYIKRVIGVPGDHVVCCNAQGLVTVNGVPLHESSYIIPGAAPSQIHFNIVVPPGRLWVMGDNRPVSDDSRMRMADPDHGTIPESEVIGRAFVIVWPPGHWRILSIPSTFSQPGIDRAAAAGRGQSAAQKAAEATLLGAQIRPEPSYVPLAAGLVAAVPLTWLQRRARRRLTRKRRAGRGTRAR